MNVVFKEITFPKLTIAKDRVELKFPVGFPAEVQNRVFTLANRIVEEVGVVSNTLRGKFETRDGKIRIQMCLGSTNGAGHSTRKSFKTFTEQ